MSGRGVVSERSFPREAHAAFQAIRPTHFWFTSRRAALRDVVARLPIPAQSRTLEVGCGDGHLLPLLPGRFRIGVDESVGDLRMATRQGVDAVVAASGERLPFRGGFALICAFDVIEHVLDDVGLLRECARLLDTDGRLVLTTPAGPELWSRLDDYAGHRRRYTRATLRGAIERAGLRVERMFPLFRCLWPLVRLAGRRRHAGRVTDPTAAYSVGRVPNALLRAALSIEWRLLGQASCGRGTSWCAVARRRPGDIT